MVNTRAQRSTHVPEEIGTSLPASQGGRRGRRAGNTLPTRSLAPQPTHSGPYSDHTVSSRHNPHPEFLPPPAQPPLLTFGSQERDLELAQLEQDEFEFLQANKEQLLQEHSGQFQDFLRRRREKRPVDPVPPQGTNGPPVSHPPHPKRRATTNPQCPTMQAPLVTIPWEPQPNVPDKSTPASEDLLEREVQALMRPLRRGHHGSPFAAHIVNFDSPDKFKLPDGLKLYNGDSDPRDFLHLFQSHMIFKKVPEPTMCNAFPLFLDGKARGWFQSLPAGSINSFEDLTRQFLGRFFQRKKHTKTVTDLMNIRQGKDETLQAYIVLMMSPCRLSIVAMS